MSLQMKGNFQVILCQGNGWATKCFACLIVIGYSAVVSAYGSVLPDSSCGADD